MTPPFSYHLSIWKTHLWKVDIILQKKMYFYFNFKWGFQVKNACVIVSLYLFSYKIFNSHALVWLFTGSDGW